MTGISRSVIRSYLANPRAAVVICRHAASRSAPCSCSGDDLDALSGELDAHPVGVSRDVVVPRGIPRGAARRRDDEPRVASAREPSHRGHPLDAGLLPDRDEHQLVPAPVALATEAIGHPLVPPAFDPAVARLACSSRSVRSVECHGVGPFRWRSFAQSSRDSGAARLQSAAPATPRADGTHGRRT